MPRPPRCRRICSTPKVDTFCPNGSRDAEPILLTLDEYEVIRLVDLEQQTHEQCAAQMDISRSTVQEIYKSSRRKLAACLVYGSRCTSPVGAIVSAEGRSIRAVADAAGRSEDRKHNTDHEGENSMKIAVTYGDGQIFQHFGHTAQFKLYEVAEGKVVRARSWIPTAVGMVLLAGLLMQQGVDTADLRRYRRWRADGAGRGGHPALRRRQRRGGRGGRRTAGGGAQLRPQCPVQPPRSRTPRGRAHLR